MRHSPERNAASYLCGTMPAVERALFERHMVDCEACWQELSQARSGRALAEGGRELAPQHMRETVRALITTLQGAPRSAPRRLIAASAVAALVLMVFGGLFVFDRPHPAAIRAVVADFRDTRHIGPQVSARLPRRLGDLRRVASYRGWMSGMRMTVHRYEDQAGHVVAVYQAQKSFPVAEGAEHSPDGDTWTARLDDVVLFCADDPVPSLVVGDDRPEVALAATRLHLR